MLLERTGELEQLMRLGYSGHAVCLTLDLVDYYKYQLK